MQISSKSMPLVQCGGGGGGGLLGLIASGKVVNMLGFHLSGIFTLQS